MYRLVSAILLLLTASSPAWAMQPELTVLDRCEGADAVIIGEVTSGEVVWTPDGQILTRRWVATQRVIRGTVPATLEINLPGGELQGLGQWVEDVPKLDEDKRYVLFLEAEPGGAWHVFGGEAGAWLVQDKNGGQGLPHLDALRILGVCRG